MISVFEVCILKAIELEVKSHSHGNLVILQSTTTSFP